MATKTFHECDRCHSEWDGRDGELGEIRLKHGRRATWQKLDLCDDCFDAVEAFAREVPKALPAAETAADTVTQSTRPARPRKEATVDA